MNRTPVPTSATKAGARTLAGRLTRAALESTALALLVAGLAVNLLVYGWSASTLQDQADVQARIASHGIGPALLFGDARAAEETLNLLKGWPQVRRATVFDAGGHPFAQYDAADSTIGHEVPAQYLRVTAPVNQGKERLGEVVLSVSQETLRMQTAMLATATLLSAALGLVVAYLRVRRVRRAVTRTEHELNQLAYFDPVTGLRNRHAAMEFLGACASKPASRFTLLLLDLDDFKLVNDTMGHSAGDALLSQLGRSLEDAFKGIGTVFRLGGDEFVAVIESAGPDEASASIGREALKCFNEPMRFRGKLMTVRASAGIANYPRHGGSAQELLRAADTAMYSAKSAGKNAYAIYDESMDRENASRIRLGEELTLALKRDELVLHYQPILELATRAVIGVEALVRWQHPTRGLLAPGAFIDVAESSGLIVELGGWVLGAATRQQAVWAERGLGHLFIAVNVSAQQLKRQTLLGQVDAALVQSRADPRHIQIELTEHALVENIAANVEMLASLRLRGIKVAIDDFGTGSSSLAYLKRLPIDKIKVDRSFVSDLAATGEDFAIVAAIVSLAEALHLEVVAEGIETSQQLAVLERLRTHHGQGYLFSRPLPAADLERYLEGATSTRSATPESAT